MEAGGELAGYTGLSLPRFHADWMEGREQPIVEIGWRLARSPWGHGYATEAARASVQFAEYDHPVADRPSLPSVCYLLTSGCAVSR
ncbi:MAG: GNAT family N-acetyltransferase [Dermatophilaceae bacterium]|nr:GNAT family N-acetyltransferase [Dermatophilaceae bacterium]